MHRGESVVTFPSLQTAHKPELSDNAWNVTVWFQIAMSPAMTHEPVQSTGIISDCHEPRYDSWTRAKHGYNFPLPRAKHDHKMVGNKKPLPTLHINFKRMAMVGNNKPLPHPTY